jgi:hypothetical protein
MSGALVISNIDGVSKAIGMLLRRGSPINLKRGSSVRHSTVTTYNDRATHSHSADEPPPPLAMSRGNDDDDRVSVSELSFMKQLERKIDAKFDTLDRKIDTLDRKIDTKFDTLDRKFDTLDRKFDALEKKVLTTNDLDRLLNVTAMRRSIVMPFSRIEHLMEDGIPLSQLEGKTVE